MPWTWWPSDEVGHTDEARKEIQEILGTQAAFDTPKPTRLIKRILEIATGPDDIVLDFFAGSGTVGQAVLEHNATDGGRRTFVLVQLPEPIDQDGMTIADVTRGRVKWAAERENERLRLNGEQDVGFRAYRLESSNFTVWDATSGADIEKQLTMSIDHVRSVATEEGMLTELLLKAGFMLTSPVIQTDFAGVPGYSVSEGALLSCLSDALSIEAFEAMVAQEPAMILVLDAGFQGNDEMKVNALQTVRARNESSGTDIALRVV